MRLVWFSMVGVLVGCAADPRLVMLRDLDGSVDGPRVGDGGALGDAPPGSDGSRDARAGDTDAAGHDGEATDDARVSDAPSSHDSSDDSSVFDAGVADSAESDDGAATTDGNTVDGASGDSAVEMDAAVDAAVGVDAPADTGATDAVGASDAGRLYYLRISEIVLYPNNDWSRSDGVGDPFGGVAGTGIVSARDQYIEVVNVDTVPIDLRGWRIQVRDASPDTTLIGEGSAVVVTSPGSNITALEPGHYAVIGDPAGFLSTDATFILRDPLGRVIDDVEVGGFLPSRDTERDGFGDGAPAPDWNGFARGTYDEAIARPDGSPDTDVDLADFIRMTATPLRPNVEPVIAPESIPPTLLSATIGSSVQVTAPIRVRVSEPITADSADSAITLTANGVPVLMDLSTFEDHDATIVLNPVGRLPFNSMIAITVRGGPGGLADKSGNTLAASQVFTFRTERAPAATADIMINEVCLSPLQDWSDDEGGDGIPFSEVPGTGLIDSTDEWIELLNRRPGTTDMSGFRIIVYNGFNLLGAARVSTSFAGSAITRVTGTSSRIDAVEQNDRVVIGNPASSFLYSTFVELRDGSGTLIDFVEIGGNVENEDRGGNGVANGAPAPGASGVSMTLADEVVARIPDGTDTGSDVGDFEYAAATPGAMNR